MAAKMTPLKATGMKHLIAGHYGATINGKQVLVKLPINAEKPADGGGMEVYPDWLVDDVPALSDVQKRFLAQAPKPLAGGNANAPAAEE